jgi:hypothetical protein
VPVPIATWSSARGVWERAESNILCGHSALYSATLPLSGSMRNGRLYPRQQQALPIAGSVSSSLPGLCTPTGRDWKGSGAGMTRKRHGINDLAEQVAILFATPNARDWKGEPSSKWDEQASLPRDVALLPTPSANQYEQEDWEERREALKAKGINGNGFGLTTAMAITELLGTPRSAEAMGGLMRPAPGSRDRSMLEGDIARLTGEGTPLPSGGGRKSSGGQLPGQLSLDDLGSG